MSTETIRLIRDGGGGGGGEGGERLRTYRYTATSRMTPALRWAAMRVVLMFHNCEGQSRKTVSTDHNFLKRKESRSGFEPRFFSLLTSLTPYRVAGPKRLTNQSAGLHA